MREQIEVNKDQDLLKRKISCVEKTEITFYIISKISMFKVYCVQKDKWRNRKQSNEYNFTSF